MRWWPSEGRQQGQGPGGLRQPAQLCTQIPQLCGLCAFPVTGHVVCAATKPVYVKSPWDLVVLEGRLCGQTHSMQPHCRVGLQHMKSGWEGTHAHTVATSGTKELEASDPDRPRCQSQLSHVLVSVSLQVPNPCLLISKAGAGISLTRSLRGRMSGFLSLSTSDTWGWIIPGLGHGPHTGPRAAATDTASSHCVSEAHLPTLPVPSCHDRNVSRRCQMSPEGQKSTPAVNYHLNEGMWVKTAPPGIFKHQK